MTIDYQFHYEAQRRAGRSQEWADAYARMIAQGKSAAYAKTYADNYEALRRARRSPVGATIYAHRIAEAEAAAFATTKEPQLRAGSSHELAETHIQALADTVEAQVNGDEQQVLGDREQQDLKPQGLLYDPALLEDGKALALNADEDGSTTWEEVLAKVHVLGANTSEEAEAFADAAEDIMLDQRSGDALPEDNQEESVLVKAYKAALRSGQPLGVAKLYADTYVKHLQAGRSEQWAHVYATQIADGQSAAYAKTYADKYEAKLRAGRSTEWADAYALQIAAGESEVFAKTYSDTYEAQQGAGRSEEWSHAYAMMIAENQASPEEATAYAHRAHPGG